MVANRRAFLVGVFLLVVIVQGGALALYAERSVTFCGDESAKQLYITLSGLMNHSYPVFQTQGFGVLVGF